MAAHAEPSRLLGGILFGALKLGFGQVSAGREFQPARVDMRPHQPRTNRGVTLVGKAAAISSIAEQGEDEDGT